MDREIIGSAQNPGPYRRGAASALSFEFGQKTTGVIRQSTHYTLVRYIDMAVETFIDERVNDGGANSLQTGIPKSGLGHRRAWVCARAELHLARSRPN